MFLSIGTAEEATLAENMATETLVAAGTLETESLVATETLATEEVVTLVPVTKETDPAVVALGSLAVAMTGERRGEERRQI